MLKFDRQMIAVSKLKKSPDIDSELEYIYIYILHHSSTDSEIKGV